MLRSIWGYNLQSIDTQVTGTSGVYRTGLAHFGTRPSDASIA